MLLTALLPSGQVLRYREFGCPHGQALFFLHGWPGEAHQGSLLHQAALDRNLRIIAPNRPGIAGSSPQTNRSLLDWPPLVDALADQLPLDRFLLLGLSGGGPYALASAWALPARVRATAIVCGALPAAPGPARRQRSPIYQGMLALHDHAPWILQAALVPAMRLAQHPPPRAALWLALRILGPRDRAALWPKDRFAHFFPAFRHAMQSGMRGLWDDGHPYALPWPFNPAEITSPLRFWHGTQDRNFACSAAAAFAASLPRASFHPCEDGHYSIIGNQAEAILDDLLAQG